MPSPERSIANERRQAILIGALTLAVLTFASVVLLVAASVLGRIDLEAIARPSLWLTELDIAAAFDILSNSAEVLAGVLAVAITVVAIVVELAATRYTHRITRLFVTERPA